MSEAAPEVLTLDEAAAFARVHRDTLSAAIRRGSVRATNVGTGARVVYRLLRSEVCRWLASGASVVLSVSQSAYANCRRGRCGCAKAGADGGQSPRRVALDTAA